MRPEGQWTETKRERSVRYEQTPALCGGSSPSDRRSADDERSCGAQVM
ncbi:hypothetical protein BACCAP_00555 [Pseudoflavonifractor capillosus ATCC 29799]|uniref:Uncharacterized protein n=1 Tax=Pseudoflavonifractor capillosus ATCC 29799 TaxID=411467 RepID=A6NQT4_9FIRM|nr:hypothetical protein BACCAP_00555 [Pseudoflavonifractor capillosus ATCC 29799]